MTRFIWNDKAQRLSWKTSGPYAGANCFRTLKAVLFDPRARAEKQAQLGGSGSLDFTGIDAPRRDPKRQDNTAQPPITPPASTFD